MFGRLVVLVVGLVGSSALMAQQDDWPYPTLNGEPPLIIAHRGASGYLPEHTLPAYDLAIDLGADYIEPDLVLTKDGVLVARHDNYLSTTTDIAAHPEFANRKVRKTIDGVEREDWFVEDFTLAELKTLRARQAFPGRSVAHDGLYEIPTFAQILDLAAARGEALGRVIGVYPETKHPAHFAGQGLDFIAPLLEALEAAGRTGPDAGVFIQSFEADILKRLKAQSDLPLVMLVYPLESGEPSVSMEQAASFASGLGPSKFLLSDDAGRDSGYVARAHAMGLVVHPWTHRADARPERFASTDDELDALFKLGIDGLFTDFTDLVRERRQQQR